MRTRSVLECGGKRSATPLSLTNRFRQALKPKRRRRFALPACSKTGRLVLASVCLLLSALCFRAWGQYSLNWSTMDGGGGTSTGGVYAVSGTIGQPDAGTMSGGNFSVRGGFWPGMVVPATGEAPTLFIQWSADSVIISWSPATAGFELEATGDLTGGGWSAAPAGNPVTIPITGPAKFYRLKKP